MPLPRFWSALLCCVLLAAQPVAGAAPRRITLLVGEALDDYGKPKPIAAWQRRLFDTIEQQLVPAVLEVGRHWRAHNPGADETDQHASLPFRAWRYFAAHLSPMRVSPAGRYSHPTQPL